MSTIATLKAVITADTAGFDAGIKRAGDGLRMVSTEADKAAAGAGKSSSAWAGFASSVAAGCAKAVQALGGVEAKLNQIADTAGRVGRDLTAAVTLPIAGIIGTALAFDDLKTRATIGFTSMTGSATIAKQTIDDLQKFAVATPFDFPGLLKNAQMMEAMGFRAQELIPTLQAVGDAVSAAGGDANSVDHVVLALSQMRASAHLTAQDMNQLVEGGHIAAWDLLAKALHKTTAEVREMSEKGLIPGAYAAKALIYEMETRAPGAMQKVGQTLMAASSNLKDAAVQALGSIFEPLYKDAARVANKVAGVLMQIKGYIEALPNATKQRIADMLLALAAVGPALLAVAGLARALALLASPLGIAAAALAYGAYWLLQHKAAAQALGHWIEAHWAQIWGAATAALVLFAGVGVVRAVAAMAPLASAALWVARVVAGAFWSMATSIAAAMGVAVWPVALAMAAIVALIGTAYLAWKNNWLGFRDIVDFAIHAVIGQIDNLLNVIRLVPGAIGDMAAGAKAALDTLASLPGSISQNLASALPGKDDFLKLLPSGLMDLFKAPDISGLMKQISSITMPTLKVAAPTMPTFQEGPGKAAKDAEKAAKKLAELFASQYENLAKQTFLIGKNGQLAQTQAEILYGALGKLDSRHKGILLSMAAQYDAAKKQQDIVDAIKKESDQAFVSGLDKYTQDLVAAAGGLREWIKLGKEGQWSFQSLFNTERMHQFGTKGKEIAVSLSWYMMHLGDAAWNMGQQAAGGLREFNRMLDLSKDGLHHVKKGAESLGQQITRLATQKAWSESAFGKIKELKDQMWDTSAAFHTAAEATQHFFDNLLRDTGTKVFTGEMKKMQQQAVELAKSLDTQAAQTQLTNWQDALDKQVTAAQAKIKYLYKPAEAAVSEWTAANKDAIDKLLAGFGSAQAAAEALAGIKEKVAGAFQMEQQVAAAEKMRDMLRSARSEMAQMTAKNPFEAWKAGLGPMPGVDPKALKDLFDYQQKVQMVKDAASGIRDTLVGAFNDAFQNGAKTFFSSVVQGFNKMLRDMAVQQLTNRAMSALMGLLGGAIGGGGGFGTPGIAPSIASAASSAFSVPSLSATPVTFGGARESGGPVFGGQTYLVGEKGPELFKAPGTGGSITPHHQLSGQGGDTYNISVNVQSSGGNDNQDRRSGQQIGQAAIEEMQRHQRRNG